MKSLLVHTALVSLAVLSPLAAAPTKEAKLKAKPAFWEDPGNISARDLTWGIGGRAKAPIEGPFTFVKEDLDGNSPKLVVRDGTGAQWKVKLGAEAKPETAVTRFVWAVGYFTDADYFVPRMAVANLPKKLRRGGEFLHDGAIRDGRWERMDHKKVSNWKWRNNPYSGTRELNGLRILMAMFNNFDMKDSQNSIYSTADGTVMVVSDLGATLGPNRSRWPAPTSRGMSKTFENSRFVTKVHSQTVDFATPSWPFMLGILPAFPLPYVTLTQPLRLIGKPPFPNLLLQRWIGKGIPRADARWIGGLLAQLTPAQIRDGFRSAGYTPDEVESFSKSVERRIAGLQQL